jgi:peptide/nickel transport system permease protein
MLQQARNNETSAPALGLSPAGAESVALPGIPGRQSLAEARRASWAVRLSALVLLALALLTLLANVLTPYDPTTISLRERLKPPTLEHPFGTDATGRDVLSRVLYGGRISLLIGVVAAALGLVIGVAAGVIAGYRRGWADEIIMYLADVQLALPFILLAVAVALVLGNSLAVLIGLAAVSTWPVYARVVRGLVLSLREREFVVASIAAGGRPPHIMRAHLLPNLVGPILVLATLSVGRIILLESGLSFLGIGVQPPTPSWGNMIGEGRDYLSSAWWIAMMPGLALMLLTMAVGTIGDWLRDLADVTAS